MRNREQEIKWQRIIEICMEDVKNYFADIEQSIEFGTYIQPANYFVSYIFSTNARLKAAQQSGLTEKINLYHRAQLKKHIIQFKELKIVRLLHKKNVIKDNK